VKRFVAVILFSGMVFSCSDRQGQLVDKKPQSSPTQSPAASSALPAGHPPLAELPMQSQPAASLNPRPQAGPVIEGHSVTVASLRFEIDPAWVSEKPTSSFRAAQFRLPAAEGDGSPAELAVFQGIGGSATMNIDRWIGQFKIPDGKPSTEKTKIDKKQIGDLQIQILDIGGTYTASMGAMSGGGAEQSGYRMLAAVVEGPGGPWHFKLVGPEKTVAKWKPAYEALINSLKPIR